MAYAQNSSVWWPSVRVGENQTKSEQSELLEPTHIIHTIVWGLWTQVWTWAWHGRVFFCFSAHALWPQGQLRVFFSMHLGTNPVLCSLNVTWGAMTSVDSFFTFLQFGWTKSRDKGLVKDTPFPLEQQERVQWLKKNDSADLGTYKCGFLNCKYQVTQTQQDFHSIII